MENASKALLIAGAILLVIAIIAIGMGIMSKTRGTIGQAENQIDTMAVQMFNKNFEQYAGTGKSLVEVKELLSVIANNNDKAGQALYRVNFSYGYYKNNSGNGTFDVNQVKKLTGRDYKYTDNNMMDDINNYYKWPLNEEYIKNKYNCIPVYDVQFEYDRIEDGNRNANGMIKTAIIYVWHE